MPRLPHNPNETEEEKRERKRGYAYKHWASRYRVGVDVRRSRKMGYYKPSYFAWIFPLVGEPIIIGPACSHETALSKRIRAIRKLIEENNAREFDVLWLYRYDNNLPQ